jgi:hypothetical protein
VNAAVAAFTSTPSSAVQLQYPRDAWRAAAAEVYPQAFIRSDTGAVVLAPPEMLSPFNLVSCANAPPAGAPLTAINQSFTVPNLGPTNWVRKSTARVNYSARGTGADGGTTFMTGTGGVSRLLGEPLTPGVHAPTALTVQGKPANAVGTVSLTAPLTITWAKSAVAPVADRFTVVLVGSGFSAVTTGEEFTFPAGLLTAGREYYVRVESGVMSSREFERRPYFHYRTSFMPVVSNVFTAQ